MTNLSDSITLLESSDRIPEIHIDNRWARARIALFGGQVLGFTPKPDNRERLWLSDKAILDGSKAIRGGIPVCWPWFANHKESNYPAHGYVRTQTWQLVAHEERDSCTEMVLQPQASKGPGFSGQAGLELTIQVGKALTLSLRTTNLGNTPFDFACALHSYLAVSDIQKAELLGVSGEYCDKLRYLGHFDSPDPYQFSEETDRIHLNPASELHVRTGEEDRTTIISSSGHDSIVVWNPWATGSRKLSDMSPDGYKRMLCVESALTQGNILNPSQTHSLIQTIL